MTIPATRSAAKWFIVDWWWVVAGLGISTGGGGIEVAGGGWWVVVRWKVLMLGVLCWLLAVRWRKRQTAPNTKHSSFNFNRSNLLFQMEGNSLK
jgi:hypothetical protein